MRKDHTNSKHGRHGKRMFGYGDLRLMVLSLASQQPRHGYEIIKCIKDQFDGAYVPSPGAVYPTLDWLADMGFVTITLESSGRKLAQISDAGTAFLEANRETADELWQRKPPANRRNAPPEIMTAMDALKLAIKGFLSVDDSRTAVTTIAQRIETMAAELLPKDPHE